MLESAVLFTLREGVARQQLKAGRDSHLLCAQYLQTKLDVLAEKMRLLEQVVEALGVERDRLEAERMDLQVLRAQLATQSRSNQ
jgi:hypothetical protein